MSPADDLDSPPARPVEERAEGAIWLPRDSESTADHEAFMRYCEPGATMASVSLATGLTRHALAALRAKWAWDARRAAWTRYLAEEHSRTAVETARAMGARHGAATARFLDWAIESIDEHRARGKLLNPKDALAAVAKVVELERLIAGETTTRTEINLAGATDAQLAGLRKAIADATGQAENASDSE